MKGIESTLQSYVNEAIFPLSKQISFRKSEKEFGLVGIFKNRKLALNNFIKFIQDENEEIVIIGTTFKGLFLDESRFSSILKEKTLQGVVIKFIISHPYYSSFRENAENRIYTDIGKETLKSLKLLQEIGIPSDNIRFYKQPSTIFGIKTSTHMLINPVTATRQAFDSPCFIFEAGYLVYDSYLVSHFNIWDHHLIRIQNIDETYQELNQNLNDYSKKIQELINI